MIHQAIFSLCNMNRPRDGSMDTQTMSAWKRDENHGAFHLRPWEPRKMRKGLRTQACLESNVGRALRYVPKKIIHTLRAPHLFRIHTASLFPATAGSGSLGFVFRCNQRRFCRREPHSTRLPVPRLPGCCWSFAFELLDVNIIKLYHFLNVGVPSSSIVFILEVDWHERLGGSKPSLDSFPFLIRPVVHVLDTPIHELQIIRQDFQASRHCVLVRMTVRLHFEASCVEIRKKVVKVIGSIFGVVRIGLRIKG